MKKRGNQKIDKVIAVDLGGTNLRVALVKGRKILRYEKKGTPKEKNILLKELYISISKLIDKDVKSIGIAIASTLKNGIIKNPPNLPFRNFNLKRTLEKKFKKKTFIENDAACVALAEKVYGYGKNKKNMIVLTLGTGIGGGIIINDKLYDGGGYGGELGHIIIDGEKEFEQVWKENRQKAIRFFGQKFLIKDMLKMKNEKAREILHDTAQCLGKGIGSYINIFDPDIVVLSGGVKETGDKFLKMIKKQTKRYITIPRKPNIKWTKINHPGVIGASLLTR
jgi:glucokinase